jgi:hypothetical protein
VDEQPAALLDWMLRISDEKAAFVNAQNESARHDSGV